ncbi:MAG: hypothetical protein Q7S79_01960 [bacterium]|nr:hypothetical protein [bacterium]
MTIAEIKLNRRAIVVGATSAIGAASLSGCVAATAEETSRLRTETAELRNQVSAQGTKVASLEAFISKQPAVDALQDSKIDDIKKTFESLANLIAQERTKAAMTKGGLTTEAEGDLVWGDQDEFAIIFGDKPMGNQTAHTAIQITDGKDTYHAIVPAGRVMRVPFATSGLGKGWQGAEWEVWGDLDKLVTRFREMNQEVVQRDGIVAPALLFAGPANEAPQGFTTTLPRGWAVQDFLRGPDGSMSAPSLKWEQEQVRGQGQLIISATDGPKVYQGWDGRNVATTRQVLVPQGTTAILPGNNEGSVWKIVGGNVEAVSVRALEMGQEWKTYDTRRGNQNLVTYWCGQGQAPQGLQVNANVCRTQ